jgi:hypothetical protein
LRHKVSLELNPGRRKRAGAREEGGEGRATQQGECDAPLDALADNLLEDAAAGFKKDHGVVLSSHAVM